MDEQPNINMSFQVEGIITFNSFGAKCRLPLFFNKLLLEKKFIRKIERDSDETAHMSRLIWIYAVCKTYYYIACGSERVIQSFS